MYNQTEIWKNSVELVAFETRITISLNLANLHADVCIT